VLIKQLIFYIKKLHAAFNWYHGSSMHRTNGQSSFQQPGALLKQLLIDYL